MADRASIQVTRGEAATWVRLNPVLRAGEHGLEEDTRKFKIGDGHSTWTELHDYYIPEDQILTLVNEALDALIVDGGGGGTDLNALLIHINSLTPHPVYDNSADLLVYYRNAKV